MLAYLLAIAVGLASLGLYLAAFFFPEVHRKNDFILSGLGMFYALVLWVCAGRITGGLLLGQMAGAGLLGWLGWETLNLRRGVVPTEQQTALPNAEAVQVALANLTKPETLAGLPGQIGGGLSQLAGRVQTAIAAGSKAKQEAATATETYVPLKREDFAEAAKTVQTGMDAVVDTIADAADSVVNRPSGNQPVSDRVAEQVTEMAADATDQVIDRATDLAADLRSGVADLSDSVVAQAADAGDRMGKEVAAAMDRTKVPKSGGKGNDLANLPGKMLGALGAIAAVIPATLQGLTKKKESQPIYVRKQFRKEDDSPESGSPESGSPEPGSPEPGSLDRDEPMVAAKAAVMATIAAVAVGVAEAGEPDETGAIAAEEKIAPVTSELTSELTSEFAAAPDPVSEPALSAAVTDGMMPTDNTDAAAAESMIEPGTEPREAELSTDTVETAAVDLYQADRDAAAPEAEEDNEEIADTEADYTKADYAEADFIEEVHAEEIYAEEIYTEEVYAEEVYEDPVEGDEDETINTFADAQEAAAVKVEEVVEEVVEDRVEPFVPADKLGEDKFDEDWDNAEPPEPDYPEV